MPRTVLAAAFMVAFALPVAAQSISIDLPHLSFPDPVVTSPSTKDCAAEGTQPVCALEE